MDELFDGLGWSGPEHETVPWIYKTRLFYRLVFEPLEDWINYHACEGWREKFGGLLSVSGCSVVLIKGLELFLFVKKGN